ncbi:MAG: thioredoxin fold domain-containing protein [Clostridia bacterium]|nr:thioredoxin fold domain-containing protein [Clostridia bacterium]
MKDGTFADEVYHSAHPTLVEFWAPWCKPCAYLEPVLGEAARALAGSVKFVRLNVDENPVAATVFGVRSVPYLILFRGEEELEKIAGFVGRDELLRRLRAALEGPPGPPAGEAPKAPGGGGRPEGR